MMNQLDSKNGALEAQVKELLEKLSLSESSYKQEVIKKPLELTDSKISNLKKAQIESQVDSATGDIVTLVKELKKLKQEHVSLDYFNITSQGRTC